jgi:tRNA(adenine34) deaminase
VWERDHERHMRRAIALAGRVPDLPFGSSIVHRDRGEIVAEGWNRSGQNPTWHGEIDALNALVAAGFTGDRENLVLYTTAEPCPMCMAAILWSGIGTVVFGTSIRFLQANGWRQIDILADEIVRRSPGWTCTVIGGVLEAECNALFTAGPPNSGPLLRAAE